MKEKVEAELFEKKLDSLSRDIAKLKSQKEKLAKKVDALEKALSEKLEKRNSLVISYIAEPLGDREVDFRQAKYLRVQLEKGKIDMENADITAGSRQEEILDDDREV